MAGGLVERLVLKAGDVLMVLPVLYVVVALRAALPLVLPPPMVVGVLATILALLGWPRIARGVWAIVRAEAGQEHVLAATAPRHALACDDAPPAAGLPRLSRRADALLVPMFVLTDGDAVVRGARLFRRHAELGDGAERGGHDPGDDARAVDTRAGAGDVPRGRPSRTCCSSRPASNTCRTPRGRDKLRPCPLWLDSTRRSSRPSGTTWWTMPRSAATSNATCRRA